MSTLARRLAARVDAALARALTRKAYRTPTPPDRGRPADVVQIRRTDRRTR